MWFLQARHKLKEITSVSGGSILNGFLALKWKDLKFNKKDIAENFDEIITLPIKYYCSKTIDIWAIAKGYINPFKSAGEYVIDSYNKYLFNGKLLQEISDSKNTPRFIFYSTGLQTGVGVRISKEYLADYRIGQVVKPKLQIAQVVAASSAFPPFLCPIKIKIKPNQWVNWPEGAPLFEANLLKQELLLVDGGVYDNLGIERLWDRYSTVLVSDAGAPFNTYSTLKMVKIFNIARLIRSVNIMQRQVESLRKRILIEDFIKKVRKGAYWGLSTNINDYNLEKNKKGKSLVKDNKITGSLKNIRTRLNSFSNKEQAQLINWGYALSDAAMRRHVISGDVAIGTWPQPEFSLGDV
jgi:NTE family protein